MCVLCMNQGVRLIAIKSGWFSINQKWGHIWHIVRSDKWVGWHSLQFHAFLAFVYNANINALPLLLLLLLLLRLLGNKINALLLSLQIKKYGALLFLPLGFQDVDLSSMHCSFSACSNYENFHIMIK